MGDRPGDPRAAAAAPGHRWPSRRTSEAFAKRKLSFLFNTAGTTLQNDSSEAFAKTAASREASSP